MADLDCAETSAKFRPVSIRSAHSQRASRGQMDPSVVKRGLIKRGRVDTGFLETPVRPRPSGGQQAMLASRTGAPANENQVIDMDRIARGAIGGRIMVVGSAGSGKSTFARELGARLRVPVVHIDQIYWEPGWTMRPMSECKKMVAEAAGGPAWVFDGNNSSTYEERLKEAETIIFLDMPNWLCLGRVLLRTLKSFGRTRRDMAPNCPERFDWPFLKFIWRFPKVGRPKIEALLARTEDDLHQIRLSHKRDVQRFLKALDERLDTSANQKPAGDPAEANAPVLTLVPTAQEG